MAKDTSPIVKQSRREGYALHPKAHKIMARKSSVPGQHGRGRQGKQSTYAVQLREKQKVRRIYGLLEKQFSNLVKEAGRKEGSTGENLLVLLEQRLDNAVYRAGLATSRRAARQLVSHGHFLLNDRRVDIPSIRLKAGDKLAVRPKAASNEYFKNIDNIVGGVQPVSWLKADPKKLTIDILGLPKRDEAEVGIDEQLIVEYYSR